MVNGGEQKPGAALGPRPRGRRWSRRSASGQRLLRVAGRRSSAGYVAAGLAVLALLGAWSLGVAGCTAGGSGYARMEEPSGSVLAKMRLSSGEISRLQGNAHYYKLMGRPELALKEMELAHQQNPDNLQIVNLLAQNYEELGNFEAARQLYQEALTRRGSHPVMANNLCFSYYQEGRWQEAEACFRQTLARDPDNVAARNNLGLLYCRLGRQDEARRLWQDAEGAAAADGKIGQALAALGMPDRGGYARRPEPAPPAARVTSAPTPGATVAPLAAPIPSKVQTPAQPVASRASEPKVAAKTASPVAVTPREKAQPQAAVPQKVLATVKPGPAPQTGPQARQVPLTAGELADAAIEVRNGTRAKNLARQTRSLLRREGFTVAGIGNHVDFGAAKTMIYYRPGAERVARTLAHKVFPGAELALSPKLNRGMNIKVLLGADLLENPQFMARLDEGAPVAKTPPAADKIPAAKTEAERAAAGRQEPLGGNRPKVQGRQPLPPQPQKVTAQPPASPASTPLTAAELADTAIEVRNGTWTKDLARNTRSLLQQEGFTVAMIGNHVDFGAAKTVIYYRPGTERVAGAVARKLFPRAELETSATLKRGMDIKILLGADLLQGPQLMARLVAGDN